MNTSETFCGFWSSAIMHLISCKCTLKCTEGQALESSRAGTTRGHTKTRQSISQKTCVLCTETDEVYLQIRPRGHNPPTKNERPKTETLLIVYSCPNVPSNSHRSEMGAIRTGGNRPPTRSTSCGLVRPRHTIVRRGPYVAAGYHSTRIQASPGSAATRERDFCMSCPSSYENKWNPFSSFHWSNKQRWLLRGEATTSHLKEGFEIVGGSDAFDHCGLIK